MLEITMRTPLGELDSDALRTLRAASTFTTGFASPGCTIADLAMAGFLVATNERVEGGGAARSERVGHVLPFAGCPHTYAATRRVR